MTQPPALFGAADAAAAYETNLVSRVFLPYAERLVDEIAPSKDEDILDLACGTGAVTRILAARCGPDRVTGIDITEAMLDVARSLVPEVTFKQGAFDALPAPDASADVVLCQQGLQFAPDRAAAVAEMARVLRPGGRIAVACWVDVSRMPLFNAFREGLIALGWDELVQTFGGPFSLPGPELKTLFTGPSFDEVEVKDVRMDLPIGDPREVALIYATVPPFSTRFLSATEADQQRYLDIVTAGRSTTEPFTTSVLTAVRSQS